MQTPFGTCGHTHYEGGPHCIHTAYLRGFEDGRDSVIVFELPCEDATDRILTDEQES